MILKIQETLKRLIKEPSYRVRQRRLITVNLESQMMLEFLLVLMHFIREVFLYLKNRLVTEEPIDHKLHWKVFSKTILVKLLDLIYNKGILNWKSSKNMRVQKIKLMSDILTPRSKPTTLLKLKIHLMYLVKLETNSNSKDSKILIPKLTTKEHDCY